MTDSILERDKFGYIELEPSHKQVAGTFTSFILTYTAGLYGMDDLGGIKIFFRYACDQSPLQTDLPIKVGYTTATASNGANVELSYHTREGKRPWYKMFRIRIAGEGLKEGETITIRIGDKRFGSPGIKLQTFVEHEFKFLTCVDIFSTNDFRKISSPKLSIVSGKPTRWKVILPTLRNIHQTFSLKIRGEDKWGNPSNKIMGDYILKSNLPVNGLPKMFKWEKGSHSHIIENLSFTEMKTKEKILKIRLINEEGTELAISNPLIIKKNSDFLYFWGDIHGQSEETIGTNTVRNYFEFARDCAFLDITGHQGNDFQITNKLWRQINNSSEEFNEPGQFITLIGYEYSANTALGGDRNVYFLYPNRQIHRSSHALISDKKDIDTDCLSVSDLFNALIEDNLDYEKTVVVIAHVGGRYADILKYHDGRVEPSIEIHSAWGTFEWLLQDAFKKDYRVGIVANGDDHKGRPGIAYPGALKFGSLGGLTCFLLKELTRESVFKALKKRHHYATTGERIYLEIKGILNFDGLIFERDPAIFPKTRTNPQHSRIVQMGDIIQIPLENKDLSITLQISIAGKSPIERIEIYNGKKLIERIRPYIKNLPEEESIDEDFRRIRIIWEGAEFKARRRNVNWTGSAEFVNNHIIKTSTFNFWNFDTQLSQESPNLLSWNSITSGNFQGFDVLLEDKNRGVLRFKSSQISFDIPISEISRNEKIYHAGGLNKQVRVFRLPNENTKKSYSFERKFEIKTSSKEDERLWIKITFENGHQAWSSPIYLIKE